MPGDFGYAFKIPNLPRDVYQYLREVGTAQKLTPWQVVILALDALEHMGRADPTQALALVEKVRREHPRP